MLPSICHSTKEGPEVLSLGDYDFRVNRTIQLFEPITPAAARDVVLQLRYLDSQGQEPIRLYINSPGGSVSDGLAIVDAMALARAPVHTVCTGMAASMGAVILARGDRRFATEHAEIMIHQPMGQAQGQATDLVLHARHIERTREVLTGLLARATGQSRQLIREKTERDSFLTPREAMELGLVDEILTALP